jgi:hypothetical protein
MFFCLTHQVAESHVERCCDAGSNLKRRVALAKFDEAHVVIVNTGAFRQLHLRKP